MAYSTKVQGTRYNIEIASSNDGWLLSVKIDDVVDEKIDLKNNSLKTIREGVLKLLGLVNVKNLNDFQMDLLAKELYGNVTGDTDLSQHNKDMQEIENKKNMMNDPRFQDSLVSEFKSSFKIKNEAPKIDREKLGAKKGEPSTPSTTSQSENSQMHAMMSEINKELGGSNPVTPQPAPVSTSPVGATESPASPSERLLHKKTDHIDTRVSSVDVEDLIQELKDTKDLLAGDIARVQLRMEKIDNIILKLSTISSKL